MPKTISKGELSDFVYQSLKELILSGRLKPGNRLVHQELGDRLQVSRTPIREALERLNQEGYAVRRPRRGFVVAEFDASQVRDLYGTREALEIYAFDVSCATGFSKKNIVELEAVNKQYAAMFPGPVSRARLEMDQTFHLTLASFSMNEELRRTLGLVFEKIILKRRVDGHGVMVGDAPLREHKALIAAMKEERYDEGREILKRHIREACNRLLNYIEQESSFSGNL